MVRLLEKKQRPLNLLVILAIAGFSLHLLVLLLLTVQGIKIRQLSLRKPPNFVQIIDGKKVRIKANLNRDPESIQQFVSKTMMLMFNWSGTLPPRRLEEMTKPTYDLGIPIRTHQGSLNKVTMGSWMASFALSEDFRPGFLREIAAMTPPEVFVKNPKQGISGQLIIKRIDPPEKIAVGKWRVGLVADLIQTNRADGRKLITPFNKDFLVRATDYFSYSLPEKMSDLQVAIYQMRSNQMEIYEIRNLCLLDNSRGNSNCDSNNLIK